MLAVATVALATYITQQSVVADSQNQAVSSAIQMGKAFTSVTKKVEPAVVFIKATKEQKMTSNMQQFGDLHGQMPDDFLKRFFGDNVPQFEMPQRQRPMVGQGSGFIISQDGYILTNNHVAGGADKLEVKLNDGRTFTAKLVGTDPHTDVAVIKIDAKNLPVLPMGNSDKIEPGEWVLAIGSPFGLTGTVTSGIVSATGRSGMGITDYEDFIQTDAAINPGNSGGPLVNLQGQAIGINTAILSRSGAYNGIGFAIPMNMAKSVVEQLIEKGSVTRGYLGVMIQPLTPELAKTFKVPDTHGVLIGDVTADGPGAKAGLQRGDVIVELDGKPIEDLTLFRNEVAMVQPGSKAKLTVMRDGQRKDFVVTVGTLPDQGVAKAESSNSTDQKLGLSVQTLNEQLAEKLGVKADSGVVITQVVPGSEADNQGLEAGMVVKQVDHQKVKTAEDFTKAVKASQKSGSVLLLVQQGEFTRFVVLKFEK
jgi:serine protease Do